MNPSSQPFDPLRYYASYPSKVIGRPGYPARAQYKSTLLWQLYGEYIKRELRRVNSYADIGGCFGFGANALAYQIARTQDSYPDTKVFEISSDFSKIGKIIFPAIDFVNEDFTLWAGHPQCFELISLFDVIEHIPEPAAFLRAVAPRTKYALLKTPMETTGEWRGSRPPLLQGALHEDGHVNFFDPGPYMRMLEQSGFEIVKWDLMPSIVPRGIAQSILSPEDMPAASAGTNVDPARFLRRLIKIPLTLSPKLFKYTRRLVGGGDHLCLIRSTARVSG